MRILEITGCTEFHGSARASIPSGMTYRKSTVTMGASLGPPEFGLKVSDTTKVKTFVKLGKSIIHL